MQLANKLKYSRYLILFLLNYCIIFSLFLTSSSISQQRFSLTANNELNIDLSVLPRANLSQNLDEWFDRKIEMLIIAPPDKPNFTTILIPLAEWKNQKGVKTQILTNYSSYPGVDTQEKIRNMIKSYYSSEKVQWVLLAGDTDLIPIRYIYNNDVVPLGERETVGDYYFKPTDFYYADINGTWDDDGDGRWGESSVYNDNGVDEIDWTPEIYVGRLPASNDEELEIMVNKTLKYETNPQIGDWMNSFLLTGVISNYPENTESEVGEDEARLTSYILSNYVLDSMNYSHLIKTTSDFELKPSFSNITRDIFRTNFDNGHSLGMFAGHGAPTKFVDETGYQFYTAFDAINSNNTNMPTLFYGDTCSTSSYDYGDNNIGEILIKRQDAGAIGYIGPLRVTWYYEQDLDLEMLNRGNCKLFWKSFFINKSYQPGKALYDSKVEYLNSDWFKYSNINMSLESERKNVLTYCLLGDPEVDIYTNIPKTPKDPFSGDIYEGQHFSMYLTDVNDNALSNIRINFVSKMGKYRTFYSDKNGYVNILFPLGIDTYNYAITGHNIKPINGSFTTLPDNNPPILENLHINPDIPSVSDNICFSINATDNESGIENIFFLISKDNFSSYNYFSLEKESSTDDSHSCTLNKLDFMEYRYAIVGFDYANNSIFLYNIDNFQIEILPPILYYVLISVNFGLLGLLAIGIIILFNNWQNYKKKYKRHEKN